MQIVVRNARRAIISGVLYCLGRAVACVALGMMVLAFLARFQVVGDFFKRYGPLILGPVLIVLGTGLLVRGYFSLSSKDDGVVARKRHFLERWGSFGMGFGFALCFGPVYAVLFFGQMVPLAAQHAWPWAGLFVYGACTGLPVFVVSVLCLMSPGVIAWTYRVIKLVSIAVGVVCCVLGLRLLLKYFAGSN
jgi:hypothetical protein